MTGFYCDLWPVHVRHAVVEKHHFIHLFAFFFDLPCSLLDHIERLLASHRDVYIDGLILQHRLDHLYVHDLIVDEQH